MNTDARQRICQAAYDDLTELTEYRIRALIARGDPEARFMAIGIWDLWYNATVGFQREGDTARLETLMHLDREGRAA